MSQILLLDPVLDMNAAVPLKSALMDRRGQAIEIDASKVQRLGGLCLQVLLAARCAWAEDGQPLDVNPRSEAFTDALRLFGSADYFPETSLEGGIC